MCVKWNDVQNLKKLQEKICAVDCNESKVQSKEILKEIGVDDESRDSEEDFEDDVGLSKNTCVISIESEKKIIEVYFRSICVSFMNLHSQGLHDRNYMYQKTPFYDSSLIKTLVNSMTVKYNPSLISCNKVYEITKSFA